MTKALGFLTGVCLTTAMIFLMLDGWQQRQSEEASPAAVASDVQPFSALPSTADAKSLDVDIVPANARVAVQTDGSVNSVLPVAGLVKAATLTAGSTNPPLRPSNKDAIDQQSLSAMQPHVAQSATAETQKIEAGTDSVDAPALDQERLQDTSDSEATRSHIFWSPFRSEWAAKGFAGRLSNATQINIEVIEVGSGRYRAAFDYQTENQRRERIERIETITGLQLE